MAWRSKVAQPLALFVALVLVLWTTARVSADSKPTSSEVLSFSHKAHAERLDIKSCSDCHGSSSADRPSPTTRSHAPCLASGCHVDAFLSTGPRAKKEAPEAYLAATQFCATCHSSKTGSPPSRFAKAKADALFESKLAADYHVEMNHREHSERTACSTCHQVSKESFTLVSGGPAHKACATCHQDSEQPMTNCKSCHSSPGPSEYFTKTRKGSDVRSCTDDTAKDRPCFRHERTEHRFLADQTPLECSSCHFMFKSKSHQGFKYETLADVKAAPVMHNKRDLAHQSCGSSGCHKREVDDSQGNGRCTQCHSAKFMANSLTD